jgi:RNA polymerase sigma-70 factor (ECF subfamily)
MKEITIPNLFQSGTVYSMSTYGEQRALDSLRKPNSQAIGVIYDQFFSEVYRYVLYRLGDQSLAEDITSDVFLRLLEAARGGRIQQSNVKNWLIATASHAVRDYLRRKYRRPVEAISESIPDGGPGIHDEFDLREQNYFLQQAYNQLTQEQQEVLTLRFSQGYSLEETALHMKKSVNAIKALQFRALAALQRQID